MQARRFSVGSLVFMVLLASLFGCLGCSSQAEKDAGARSTSSPTRGTATDNNAANNAAPPARPTQSDGGPTNAPGTMGASKTATSRTRIARHKAPDADAPGAPAPSRSTAESHAAPPEQGFSPSPRISEAAPAPPPNANVSRSPGALDAKRSAKTRAAKTRSAKTPGDPVAKVKEFSGDAAPEEDVDPWTSELSSNAQDYTVVTVFYGTDRKPLGESEHTLKSAPGWFLLTASLAVLTILLAVLALWRSGSRGLRVASAFGAVLTVVLGASTIAVRVQRERLDPGDHVNYGNDRGELQMGTCEVSVPKYHEAGNIERPSILRFEFAEDPRNHLVLLDVEPTPAEGFYANLKDHVQKSPEKEAFVFVHGYNVTFDDAARRTAQLAYDLKFEGAPIFFSWPSQGGLLKYAVDETNVAWAVPHLKQFMADVAKKSGAKSVHLIAHSMGNRALTSALQNLAQEMRRDRRVLFDQVILTAPDVDADVFKRDIAPAIAKTAQRVTLYASSNDEALALSQKLHGYPRAGDSGAELIVVPGIDTIDVSEVDTSLIGHSYYGSNDSVLTDMFYLLHGSKPPQQRQWLRAVSLERLTYWIFFRNAAVREASTPETIRQ